MEVRATEGQTISLWSLIVASLNLTKQKIVSIGVTIKNTILGAEENVIIANKTVLEGRATAQNLFSIQVERAKSALLGNNIRLKIIDNYMIK